MKKQTILLVDDDPNIVQAVLRYLQWDGYNVLVADNGRDALSLAIVQDQPPACIVLDVMLQDVDGWEILRRIRANPHAADIPVIMLTARVADHDKIHGLDLGADDYVTKPFNPHELLARIRARLRRAQPSQSVQQLQVGQLVINLDAYAVTVDGAAVDLTPTEFDLLHTLMQHPGRAFARDELLEEALGYTYEGLGRALDSHSKNLRRKIASNLDADAPQPIQTVYGVGYRLVEDSS